MTKEMRLMEREKKRRYRTKMSAMQKAKDLQRAREYKKTFKGAIACRNAREKYNDKKIEVEQENH